MGTSSINGPWDTSHSYSYVWVIVIVLVMIHTPVYISQGNNDLIFDKSPDLSRLFTSLC